MTALLFIGWVVIFLAGWFMGWSSGWSMRIQEENKYDKPDRPEEKSTQTNVSFVEASDAEELFKNVQDLDDLHIEANYQPNDRKDVQS